MSEVIKHELHHELKDWLNTEDNWVREPGKEPKGFRDLMWCPYLNEPAILEYKDDRPHCPNCNGNFEASSHAFMGHIFKPFR